MNRQLADSHRPMIDRQPYSSIAPWNVECTCGDWRHYCHLTREDALTAHDRHVEREMTEHSE